MHPVNIVKLYFPLNALYLAQLEAVNWEAGCLKAPSSYIVYVIVAQTYKFLF